MDRGCADRLARYVVSGTSSAGGCVGRQQQKMEDADCPQPSVNIIVFSVLTFAFGISFSISSVFPWYMSIVLSPAGFFVMPSVRGPKPFAILAVHLPTP